MLINLPEMESPLNSPLVWVAAFGFLGTFAVQICQLLIVIISRNERNSQHAETSRSIEVVRQEVNGKATEALRVSGDAREAIGNLAGRAQERMENSITG